MKGKTLIGLGILLLVTNSMTAAFFSTRSKASAAAVPGTALARRPPASENLPAILQQLNNNVETWSSVGQADRVAAVDAVIKLFQTRENVAILNTPEFYSQRIDEYLGANPTMRSLTLPTLIKIASVMEYDFYNGQNKDDLAQQVLGPQLFEQNRQRLGLTPQQ